VLARSCSGHMVSAINVLLTFAALCFTHRGNENEWLNHFVTVLVSSVL